MPINSAFQGGIHFHNYTCMYSVIWVKFVMLTCLQLIYSSYTSYFDVPVDLWRKRRKQDDYILPYYFLFSLKKLL